MADIAVRGEDYPIYYLQHIFVVGPLGRLQGVAGLTDIAGAKPERGRVVTPRQRADRPRERRHQQDDQRSDGRGQQPGA